MRNCASTCVCVPFDPSKRHTRHISQPALVPTWCDRRTCKRPRPALITSCDKRTCKRLRPARVPSCNQQVCETQGCCRCRGRVSDAKNSARPAALRRAARLSAVFTFCTLHAEHSIKCLTRYLPVYIAAIKAHAKHTGPHVYAAAINMCETRWHSRNMNLYVAATKGQCATHNVTTRKM